MHSEEEKENYQVQENNIEGIRNAVLSENPLASEFCVNVVADWLSRYNDGVYLGCENNKIGNSLVAVYHYNVIYLFGDAYTTIMYAPKLMFHFVSPTHIHIDDVLMRHNDVGNGSIAMKALIKYARLCGVKKLTGHLSSVDDDHKARRDHYYSKFGFIVGKNSIIKNLAETE